MDRFTLAPLRAHYIALLEWKLPWPHWQILPPAHFNQRAWNLDPWIQWNFTKAITACGGRSGSWRFAIDIFGALRVLSFEPHQMSYNTAMSALECPEFIYEKETGRLEGWNLRGKENINPAQQNMIWYNLYNRNSWQTWSSRCFVSEVSAALGERAGVSGGPKGVGNCCVLHGAWCIACGSTVAPGIDILETKPVDLRECCELQRSFELLSKGVTWKVHIYRSILWFLSLPIWIPNSESVCALPKGDLQIAAT